MPLPNPTLILPYRDMAKLLIQLSIREPGDNFKNAEFRWTRYDERIPGWSVPAPWTTRDESSGGEGGPRHHGWFSFEYQTFDEGGSEVRTIVSHAHALSIIVPTALIVNCSTWTLAPGRS